MIIKMTMYHFPSFFLFFRILLCLTFSELQSIDIESLQNRLLKFCYVPATGAGLPRLLFFAVAINSTNEANKVALSSLYNLDGYAAICWL
jgi:hypothetical protein